MSSTLVFLFVVFLMPSLGASQDINTAAVVNQTPKFSELAVTAPHWQGRVIAKVHQSYVGWDVEIGDADNDGQNEILVTGCPDSRLYLFKKLNHRWQSRLLAENLAQREEGPGMGLVVKVVDLNADGRNELILGTGQEQAEPAFFYVMQTDGFTITRSLSSRPLLDTSAYTHNLAFGDVDKDGVMEVFSAYCGSGEVVRYDLDTQLATVQPSTIYQCTGSGEDSLLVDVDNDGSLEYITCNCYRQDKARVEIFEFDAVGKLVLPPRVVIHGFDGLGCFNCSTQVGDIDNDGRNELIVGWKTDPPQKKVNHGTILGYRVNRNGAHRIYTFAYKDKELDMGYFEKMMCVADADNDGDNDLVVTTRGEQRWGGGGLGHVFMFEVETSGEVKKTLLVNFAAGRADACWPAVGDADNDGRNEIVIATGRGHREKPGNSYVVLVEKE